MRKKFKKPSDWLFILIGIALIGFALFKINQIYPIINLQNIWGDSAVEQEGFASILLPESSVSQPKYARARTTPPLVPDRILIEKIGLDAPVVTAKSMDVTIDGKKITQFLVPEEFAAGWHDTSAPLGEIGNTVISGHHNAYGKVFEKLVSLKKGDQVILKSGDQVFTYKVSRVLNLPEKNEPLDVRLENARWIMPSDDERVTLVTCWPKYSDTNRILVLCVPDEGDEE